MEIKHAPDLDKLNYKLKTIEEDFIVEELFNYELLEKGSFYVYKLVKENLNTHNALRIISQKLNISQKDIGYAGLKDRRAVTIQYISIPSSINLEKDYDFSDDNSLLQLIRVGFRNERIYPGCLSRNKFEIVVRDLDSLVVERFKDGNLPSYYINFFGEQRFSTSNNLIGKCMIKKEYKEALDFMLATFSSRDKEKLEREIDNCNGNYLHAILTVDKKLLRLYLHAYQSELWNKAALKYLERKGIKELLELDDLLSIYIPMIGFDIDGEGIVVEIVEKIMELEGLNSRDLILRQFQGLGLEGGNRSLVNKADDAKVIDINDDEFNSGKNKIILSFKLPKGSYATEYIRQLIM